MKKITPHTWTILFAVIALAALLILAASLNTLQFRDGKPLPFSRLAPDLQGGGNSDFMSGIMVFFRGLMIFMWVLLPIYLIYLIVSKEARKRLLRDMALLLPILILLYFITNNINNQKPSNEDTSQLGMKLPNEGLIQPESVTLPEFQPPPPWVTTVTSLILATVTVVLISAAVYMIWKRTRAKESSPLQRIEMEAREAIDSLEGGGDLREVIQRCYLQMVIAMREYRMINRQQDMTPHEFEQVLAGHGLPDAPVHQLTVLFEQVRYGAYNPGRQEERAAISSLNAIISACQRIATRAKP
ncbi:MAG: DUF4129 domain-containing protein [Anaerolineaceae bacterium]|nr:DUF4129 domain-containing protein [Anaerolineaceae bacterium]